MRLIGCNKGYLLTYNGCHIWKFTKKNDMAIVAPRAVTTVNTPWLNIKAFVFLIHPESCQATESDKIICLYSSFSRAAFCANDHFIVRIYDWRVAILFNNNVIYCELDRTNWDSLTCLLRVLVFIMGVLQWIIE